jgi:gluconate 2-dehydrogenase alpha chain
MATRLPEVDAVLLGVGLVGTLVGHELTRAGLKVVGLERGEPRFTVPDFQSPQIHDELRYSVRKALMQDNTKETLTFRNNSNETALPIRRWGSFLPGTGLGGAAVHWNGQSFRFMDHDFKMYSQTVERYGKNFMSPEITIQDWGISSVDLEPHFTRFEYLLGVSGKAGNLQGKKIPGGNPFEDPRSREYPTPPMKEPYGSAIFRKAAEGLGYHPYPQPSGNLSQPYTNPEGMMLSTCMFCGFCERYGCEHYAKSSPQTVLLPVLLKSQNFTLRTQCQVLRINLDKSRKVATGVTYVDASGRETEQPARLVIVGTYAFNNVRMLLLSGIGTPYDPKTTRGVVGRNYAYQTQSSVQVFYDQKVNINPFMRSGANGTLISDFVDDFDHGPLGFVGGSYIGEIMTNGRPIEFHPTPPGTPTWGADWKKAMVRNYNHTSVILVNGSSVSTTRNYLDLDPTYKDAWGLPLLRMTFDFPENDLKMAAWSTQKGVEIGKAMSGQQLVAGNARKGPYNVTQYQSTHNTGGAVMGNDRSTSVVNRYLQSWDVHNVFVIGASAFPQNSVYNPTITVGALAYWASDSIVKQYIKSPGPLV